MTQMFHPLLLGRLPEQHREGPSKPNTEEKEDKEVLQHQQDVCASVRAGKH